MNTENREQQLIEALKISKNGLNIKEITSILNVSARTAQRLIVIMTKSGDVAKDGTGKNTRYLYLGTAQMDDGSGIALSGKARSIFESVNRALTQRTPIGYQHEFLQSYIPNETYYLAESTRDHLKKIGSSALKKKQSMAGTFAKHILNRFLVDLAWNSSRLEGNTYSLLETQELVLTGHGSEKRSKVESQMILNHKNAIEFLVNNATDITFSLHIICSLHALLSDNLLGNPMACGRVRQIAIGIHKTTYIPAEIPQIIEERLSDILSKVNMIKDPFEQAFFAMVHLPYLQPFEYVNKRVSRLAANIPLIKQNLCPISFIDVPNKLYISGLIGVYEENKIELLRDIFVWAYERSCSQYLVVQHAIGEPDSFRLQYHSPIKFLINKIIIQKLNRKQTINEIETWTKKHILVKDQPQFIDIINIEIISLHSGNIARYQVNEKQFSAWKKSWDCISQD